MMTMTLRSEWGRGWRGAGGQGGGHETPVAGLLGPEPVLSSTKTTRLTATVQQLPSWLGACVSERVAFYYYLWQLRK